MLLNLRTAKVSSACEDYIETEVLLFDCLNTGTLAMYPKKTAIWPVHSFPETANKNQIT
jgi:hypothetical protein